MKAAIALTVAMGLLAQAGRRPAATLPSESAGWDNVLAGLLSVFEKADVLALGEAHNRKIDSDLRLRLIRYPGFASKVHAIVVEATGDQPLLSRYVRGDSLSAAELLRLWPQRPLQSLRELFETVRDVNQNLPSKALMVYESPAVGPGQDRNGPAAAVIRDRVAAGEKVLVIYGSGHTWHREGGLTTALERSMPGRVFAAEVFGPVGAQATGLPGEELQASLKGLEDTLSSHDRPVLIFLRGTPASRLLANPFYLGQEMLPPSTTIGDLDDACVFFGRAPELGTSVSGR